LYLIDIRSLTETRKLTGLLHPQAMAWTKDSRTLALSATFSGRDGTWTYDVVSGRLRRISKKTLHWISWSPDGRSLAGFVDKGTSPGQPINYELVILDASALRSTG
jgi:Tol biopolymer transport system component